MSGAADWAIVGIFEDGGGIAESEIWTDTRILQSAYRRGETYQSVYARLDSTNSFTAFRDALTSDPKLQVDEVRQADYYARQSQVTYNLVNGLGSIISFLMGIGALFGALNTMYNAVASRTRGACADSGLLQRAFKARQPDSPMFVSCATLPLF